MERWKGGTHRRRINNCLLALVGGGKWVAAAVHRRAEFVLIRGGSGGRVKGVMAGGCRSPQMMFIALLLMLLLLLVQLAQYLPLAMGAKERVTFT